MEKCVVFSQRKGKEVINFEERVSDVIFTDFGLQGKRKLAKNTSCLFDEIHYFIIMEFMSTIHGMLYLK